MLIALSGPSGIGKGFIKNMLMAECPGLSELPWLTTRLPRQDESLIGNRTFVNGAEFDDLDCVLVQSLYGNLYGLERKHLLPQETKRLTEIHPDNVANVLAIAPDAILIGLVTSDTSLLAERMAGRDEEDSSLKIRLEAAYSEMELIESQRRMFHKVVEISRDIETTKWIVHYLKTLINSEGESHA